MRLGQREWSGELFSVWPKACDSIVEQFRDDICTRIVLSDLTSDVQGGFRPSDPPLVETSTHPPHNRLRLSKPKQAHIFIPPLIFHINTTHNTWISNLSYQHHLIFRIFRRTLQTTQSNPPWRNRHSTRNHASARLSIQSTQSNTPHVRNHLIGIRATITQFSVFRFESVEKIFQLDAVLGVVDRRVHLVYESSQLLA